MNKLKKLLFYPIILGSISVGLSSVQNPDIYFKEDQVKLAKDIVQILEEEHFRKKSFTSIKPIKIKLILKIYGKYYTIMEERL